MSKNENPQSNISGDIDTDGGMINSGSINTGGGDVIGRDKIDITNITRLDPSDARAQRNHAALRDAVRIFWVDGVLKNSLYNELLIRLDMEQQPDAVNNRPWNLILQQPEQPDLAIADDKQIIGIFKEMGQQMLILGEPGSGKTITLLTLADALLEETKTDPTLPTPVVFNLSSWAEKQPPLDEWLVEELNQRYHMPRKVSQNWVENDELLLLLDGLDEVAADKRDACVSAINAFQKEHIVSMVVCSRIAEYQALINRLNLTGAIAIRPLTDQQISDYIARADPHLAALNHALTNSPELRELAQTPLMLSIMTLTYHDQHEASQNTPATGRSEQQHLFDGYIRHMFQHRNLPHLYVPAKMLRWLQWLAEQMVKRSQTTFYIERLQPDWLAPELSTALYRPIFGLIFGLIGGLLSGLTFGLMYGLDMGLLLSELEFEMLTALKIGLIGGLERGILGGLSYGLIAGTAGVLIARSSSTIQAHEKLNFSWRNGFIGVLISLLLFGVFGGVSAALFGRLSRGLNELMVYVINGVVLYTLIVGLMVGPIVGLIVGLFELKSWHNLRSKWRATLIRILTGMLLFGLIGWLIGGLMGGQRFQLIFGLSVGWVGGLMGGVCGEKRSSEASVKTVPNQGVWQSLKNALTFGLITWLIVGLIASLIFGLFAGPEKQLKNGLIVGLIGGFSGGLNFGLLTCIQHLALRSLLTLANHTPRNYARFLDYAASRLFLRKVGGGYIFIHRMVLEHIAALTDADMARITADLEDA